MSYKDKHGIWRKDAPEGDNGEEPFACPNCGGMLDMDRLDMDDDEMDHDLLADWADHQLGDLNDDDRWYAFCYTCSYAVCDDCELWLPYGPDYYFDVDTLLYDKPKPLAPDEAEKAEVETERLAQEAAGQMRMFE